MSLPGVEGVVARRDAAWAVVWMCLFQIANAVAWLTLPVVAPTLLGDAGLPGYWVAHMAGFMFLSAIGPTLFSARITARLGPVLTTQLATLLSAAGLLVIAQGSLPAIVAGLLMIGIGYGTAAPAASVVLSYYTSARRRALVFSIRQSGVPIGGVIVGLLFPALLVGRSAAWVLGVAACMCVAIAALSALHGRAIDAPLLQLFRGRGKTSAKQASLGQVMRMDPRLKSGALNAFAFGFMQNTIFASLVVFVVSRSGYSLIDAGIAFSAMSAAGAVSRVALGLLADARQNSGTVLLALAAGGGVAALLLFGQAYGQSFAGLVGIAVLLGATISGWNGVFIADMSRILPVAYAGHVSSLVMALIFLGNVAGPVTLAVLVQATGSYPVAAVPALMLAAASAWLLLRQVRRKQAPR